MSRFTKVAVLSLFIGFLSSCSHTPDIIDMSKLYRKDMSIEVNGLKGKGTLVVPQSNYYEFKIKGIANLDLFTISTCSREITQEEAGGTGWFTNKKKFEFKFEPLPIEMQPGCPIRLSALTKSDPKHSWGYVDFQDNKHTLTATLQCNGRWIKSAGVSICQARKGLIQKISFQSETKVSQAGDCRFQTESDVSQAFEFTVSQGECVYLFKDTKGERFHRLTTIGYDQIILED